MDWVSTLSTEELGVEMVPSGGDWFEFVQGEGELECFSFSFFSWFGDAINQVREL